MADGADAVQGALTRKLGPLPVVAWGGIAGVLILAGRWLLRRHNAGGTPDESAATTTATTTADGSLPSLGGTDVSGLAPSSTVDPQGGSNYYSGQPAAPDNASWLASAFAKLQGDNSAPFDGLAAQTALSKFLQGGATLSKAEGAIISRALALAGPPPIAVQYSIVVADDPPVTVVTPPASQVDPPATTPPPAPAAPVFNPAVPSPTGGMSNPPTPAWYDPYSAGQDWNRYDPASGQYYDARYVHPDGHGGLLGGPDA